MEGRTTDILVSVVMPAYNASAYIEHAIESVLNQNVLLELIIINDCSTDNSEDVIKKYLYDERIIYFANEKNLGCAETRNLGTERARGRYIAFLDADDWWQADKLEKQITCLEKENVVLCCTARELYKNDGTPAGKIIAVSEKITYHMLLRQNCINCSSVLIRADIAREFLMKHSDAHEDYYTWLCILKKYKTACGINEPLLKYRLSAASKSGNKFKSAWMTFKVYRYMQFGLFRSFFYLMSYMYHGIKKYRGIKI